MFYSWYTGNCPNPPHFCFRVLNNYLVWRTIQTYIPHLSKNYIHAASVFQSALTGRKETPEDYVACFDFVEDRMGAALGALYSQSHYGENDVNKVSKVVFSILLFISHSTHRFIHIKRSHMI